MNNQKDFDELQQKYNSLINYATKANKFIIDLKLLIQEFDKRDSKDVQSVRGKGE